MNRIYFDHNSTTPLDPRVLEAMMPYFRETFGNASSVHSFGQFAKAGLEKSRETVAELINCRPEEIYFTCGGTESDNTALKGVAEALAAKGRHIITAPTEHHAITESCEYLEKHGCQITYLGVDRMGYIDPDELRDAIRKDTILISIMHANNETGTIQDIAALAGITHESSVYFHTDAVQSLGKINVDVRQLGVDLLSGSAHKFYGPKGVGFLYAKAGTRFSRFMHGGAHEKGKRATTENVPGVVGLAKALEFGISEMEKNSEHISKLADRLYDGVFATIPEVVFNGDPDNRIKGTLNFTFTGAEGEATILSLDMKGIAVSSGSACTAGSVEPSHVLLAMGVAPEAAQASIRISIGKGNTKKEVDCVLTELPQIIERLRMMSPIYAQSRTG